MSSSLKNSMFHQLIFPDQKGNSTKVEDLCLQKVRQHRVSPLTKFKDTSYVIFDFETTGLSHARDEIIEIGALKIDGDKPAKEFSYLIKPSRLISPRITEITGITNKDLESSPSIDKILPKFLEFVDGSIIIAHNADFDVRFLRAACNKMDLQINLPALCTLKMARKFLADLPNRTLDTLAEHYQLSFESRHRSIGDCKVTLEVFKKMFNEFLEQDTTWATLKPFNVSF